MGYSCDGEILLPHYLLRPFDADRIHPVVNPDTSFHMEELGEVRCLKPRDGREFLKRHRLRGVGLDVGLNAAQASVIGEGGFVQQIMPSAIDGIIHKRSGT